MAKILVLEADAAMGERLCEVVQMGDHSCACIRDLDAAQAAFSQFDLALIDTSMPIPDLEVLLRAARARDLPVIIIGGPEHSDYIAHCLNMGADDYVMICCERCLLARIEVVLQRSRARTSMLKARHITLLPDRQLAYRDGEPVQLSPKECALLAHLMRNKGVLFTREQLLQSIWGIDQDQTSRTVDMHIQRLRTKLGAANQIATIQKQGYRFDDD